MNDSPSGARHQTVAPESFEPSRGPGDGASWVRRALLGAIFGLLFAIAFGAWYVFTGHSVRIAVSPAPDRTVLSGGLLRVNLGDRWLLRPGAYRLEAFREGYHPLDETLAVADTPDQRFAFELEKLPGRLTVSVLPREAGATVLLDGEPVGAAPLAGYTVPEGSYVLAAEAPRYRPSMREITVEGGGLEQTYALTLEPDWAEVSVRSEPPGATLRVDGEPLGETPLTAEVLSGRRTLALQRDGYEPWSRTIDVEAGVPQALGPVVLEPVDHLLRIVSVPGGASVAVDGEYRGQTPLMVELPPGARYRVSLSLPGYRPASREVAVGANEERSEASFRLVPVLGTVIVRGGPAGAEVFVDGAARGVVGEPIELPAHPHRLEVRKEGWESFRTTVTPNPAVEQVVEARMASDAERARARTPEILDTVVGAQLRLFRPSGIFRLGSPRREQGRRSNEFQRQVQLERPFYLGIEEITNEQFARFRSAHDSGVAGSETLSLDAQPVVRVSWDDAARFCNWLSEREGLPAAYRAERGRMVPVSPMTTGFRLPTEAEWVLVARYGGSSEGRAGRRYEWGDELPPPQGTVNVAGREAAPLIEAPLTNYVDPFPAAAPVGQLAASAAGLYDLGGNVTEWMHDYYAIRVADPPGTVDPLGPATGETHLLRGASWRSARITELRLAWRGEGSEGSDDIGFRIARYAE